MTGTSTSLPAHVFVSYAGRDRAWAEWAAWTLKLAGFSVELDEWDWSTGDNFVHRMSTGLQRADVVISLWSDAYFEPLRFTNDEWTAVAASRGLGRGGPGPRLVPLWISKPDPAKVPVVLRPLIAGSLYALGEDEANEVLLSAVTGPRAPLKRPPFPGPA